MIHPFRAAVESADVTGLAAILTEDVEFHSPFLLKPLRGRAEAMRFLSNASTALGPLPVDGEIRNGSTVAMSFATRLGPHQLNGSFLYILTDAEQVATAEIFMRPFPVVSLFRDAYRQAPSVDLDPTRWELSSEARYRAPSNRQYITDVHEVEDLPLSPNVSLHASVLTKPVVGAALVSASLSETLAALDSPRLYMRLVGQGELVRVLDGAIDGHTCELLSWIRFNFSGEAEQIVSYARPWPVVALLRDALRARIRDLLPADSWEL